MTKKQITKLVVLAVDVLSISYHNKEGLMSFGKPIHINTLLDNIYNDIDHYHYSQRIEIKDQLFFHLSLIPK